MSDCQVLIVGGRSTGLMMACELARRGVAVRIIDRSPGIDPHVRANLLHSRTLEIFQGLGLDEEVTDGSIEERCIRLFANGQPVSETPHAPIDSPFPFGMSQSQAHTEAVLERRLASLGVRVERSVELTALEQDDSGVVATVVDAVGQAERVGAAWLVGCDGAHSATRHLSGCAFYGEGDPYPYALTDAVVEGELDEGTGYAFLHDEGDLFIFSTLPEGRRLVCASLARGDAPEGAPTLELLQQLVDRRGLPGLQLSDPRWLTYFRISYRLAPHYREGRVFLAGDAAHIHSLLAGQGMNVGIQDAFNLGWKLAGVIHGVLPDAWLESYEIERRAVGEQVVEMTKQATEQFERYAGLSDAERARLVEHMLVPDTDRLNAARHLQQVDVDYGKSPLSQAGEGDFEAGPAPGAQAPDATGIRWNDTETSLYRQLGSGKAHLLLFEGSGGSTPEERKRALEAVRPHIAWVEPCVVSRTPRADVAPATRIEDPDGGMHDRYGATERCAYLVRPDGYVATRTVGWSGVVEPVM